MLQLSVDLYLYLCCCLYLFRYNQSYHHPHQIPTFKGAPASNATPCLISSWLAERESRWYTQNYSYSINYMKYYKVEKFTFWLTSWNVTDRWWGIGYDTIDTSWAVPSLAHSGVKLESSSNQLIRWTGKYEGEHSLFFTKWARPTSEFHDKFCNILFNFVTQLVFHQ